MTDPTPLQERIARAIYEAETPSPRYQWATLRNEAKDRRRQQAVAVLPIIAAEVRSARATALRAEALDISFIEIEDDYDRLDYSTSREFYEDMARDHLRARATDIEQED